MITCFPYLQCYYGGKLEQKAQKPQKDCATRYVSKFVLRFTSYGSYKCTKQQN